MDRAHVEGRGANGEGRGRGLKKAGDVAEKVDIDWDRETADQAEGKALACATTVQAISVPLSHSKVPRTPARMVFGIGSGPFARVAHGLYGGASRVRQLQLDFIADGGHRSTYRRYLDMYFFGHS